MCGGYPIMRAPTSEQQKLTFKKKRNKAEADCYRVEQHENELVELILASLSLILPVSSLAKYMVLASHTT